MLKVEVSCGELIDKITILRIKAEQINDSAKLDNITRELSILNKVALISLSPSKKLNELTSELKAVNETLWKIEDEIRACESQKDFGERFINLARSVYFTNDKRSDIKRQINQHLGSSLMEEKSYTNYQKI